MAEMRGSPWTRGVPKEIYWQCQRELVRRALTAPNVAGIVACDPEDEEHLYAAVVYQPDPRSAIVHWVYVKGAYRRLGLASTLLEAAVGDKRPIFATQLSTLLLRAQEMVDKHHIVFCPYLLLGIYPEWPLREAA